MFRDISKYFKSYANSSRHSEINSRYTHAVPLKYWNFLPDYFDSRNFLIKKQSPLDKSHNQYSLIFLKTVMLHYPIVVDTQA
jgi:hypothetical protein